MFCFFLFFFLIQSNTYQVCELDEFLNNYEHEGMDEFISHEEFMATREPLPEEFIKKADEFTEPIKPTEYAKDGDITRLLRQVPGVLGHVATFPKSYSAPKTLKQPDIILNDRIPILLSEEFFKFHPDPVDETTDLSNCEGDTNSNHGSSSSGYNGKNDNDGNGARTEANNRRRFWTVFSDSNFDEVTVEAMKKCTISEQKSKAVNLKSAQKYYTPYEIYMKKRGNLEKH